MSKRPYVPNYPDSVVVVVIPSEAHRFGFVQAGVLNQIRYWCGFHKSDALEASSEDLANLTGLSPDQVRRAVKSLIDDGALAKERNITGQGDQKCRYRPLVKVNEIPTIEAVGDSATPVGDSATPGVGDSATPSSSSDERSFSPPAPPQAGGDQPELFADGDRGRVTRAEKKRARDPHHLAAAFEPIWKTYSSEGGSKGKKAEARADFEAALKRGATCGEILTAVENHRAARVAYYEIWGVWPSLVHACRFFRNNLEDFDHPWTQDELRYWPPPRGKDWEHTKKRRSVEEILATGANY